ncbi:hypothetical protein B7R22_09870 [Subtercola boreus]|uniref:Uncharacterized protein n=1 Tax=Subtercola boreus TaxID=120213 RepID=A0A3E0VWG2_9MICO|nr:hypothetical protein [Subtercola boreus]RFA13935.1 hypothetical protein B7R22_09870 [Subtercola boreus]
MSVLDRVEDSRILLRADRLEGAMLTACVAIAAAARVVRPNVSNREAFTKFLTDRYYSPIRQVEFRNQVTDINDLLYHWMRNELVHTGDLPIDIDWMTGIHSGTLAIRAGGAPDYKLLMSPTWIDHLLTIASEWVNETSPD